MTDPKDPYTWPAFIPPFHVPPEKRVAVQVAAIEPRSKWVCSVHGFRVAQCCHAGKPIQKEASRE